MEYHFPRHEDSGAKSLLYLIGGSILLLVFLGGVGLIFLIDVNPITLQFLTTMPLIFSIGCFSAAWHASKTPTRVSLYGDRVEAEFKDRTEPYPFTSLSMCTVTANFIGRRRLRLYDLAGRKVLVIPDSIQYFDELIPHLRNRIESTASPQIDLVKKKKSRRQGILMMVLGIFFLALIITLFVVDRIDARNNHELDTKGVETTAIVKRHYLAPDGRTRRIEYEITPASGKTFTGDCEIDARLWDELSEKSGVQAIYLPNRPGISRLKSGEIAIDFASNPAIKIVIYIFGTGMSLFLIAGAILNLKGYDLDFDSVSRKFSIKKYGSGS